MMRESTTSAENRVVVQQLAHAFGSGETRVPVLHELNLRIASGEVVVLMGPSGSGKTTLLTLIGALRSVQQGSVRVLEQELAGATETELRQLRQRLGFIFQAHNLHRGLTALENVRMGLEIHGRAALRQWQATCEHALNLVGLADRRDFLPAALSGGQKQRVAIARALVGDPEVILADEPTAALDAENGRKVMQLLRRLADRRGSTVLIVTHDHRILDLADRIVRMEDGRIVRELPAASAGGDPHSMEAEAIGNMGGVSRR
ncbi:ATP-binding cassette domain-containing protein [Tuwongella immobilis]|uniref:ABC transporter domain-containing protein n=1 Tax=Tuwongella immobilis TaxID=692036 RepID=A0A6C2YTL6_9BACT|nr:ATP-binding cassette domain-containing protein [Tuwongella immobilis]VIP04687.1 abc transporter : DevA-like ABC transporter ATPase component OS=Polymorphum gilvum (strain LMG 25793 / CGMCC 1.9160 / SL003B-26A1) GN=SL003B_1469 PE=3 SV=1: ABC_tran [Tuwongella immobilis]VTS06733.1 abc transporter : DevA-like ABC transporter ATPase component OS=Polymorphum gilvum (strain LMG 25793 / CGMCC 1.9160 / SL003B-26A1) GN=SL003B_1469 PE=3 SV=1: ABC_tran [Tuwongella immobilis]